MVIDQNKEIFMKDIKQTNIINLDLAKRAVACADFSLIQGMRAFDTQREVYVTIVETPNPASNSVIVCDLQPRMMDFSRSIMWWLKENLVPDLEDPATIGCFLELIQKALGRHIKVEWGRRCETVCPNYGEPIEWLVWGMDLPLLAKGSTKSEALVAALEAAQKKSS